MREILLVNIVGTDRPGLTHALTTILAEKDIRVLDLGQAVIHEHLSLGMLLDLPRGQDSFESVKQLLYKSHSLGLSIRLTPVTPEEYEDWVGAQTQERMIFTILGHVISAQVLAQFTGILAEQGLNIEKISRLSRRIPLEPGAHLNTCFEFSVIGTPIDRDRLHDEVIAISHTEEVDIAIQVDDMYRRNRRLVVFDMDSTLIKCEVIDELAKLAGVGDEVSAITERAMRGEIDFQESFTKRLSLLRGLSVLEVERFGDRLPLMDGAERLIKTLKKLGYHTAICSGGFTLFGHILQEKLGIDHVHGNELDVEDGRLTGRVKGEIVDGARKALLMRQIAGDLGLSLAQVIAVGDGANDVPMIRQAGLGIAFRAKPIVRENAPHALSVLGLDGILYLIGVRDRDLLAQE